jgi:hypothetical protein
MPFAWQVNHDRKFRFAIYGLSLLTATVAIVYVILGFVSFYKYLSWSNGSFVGGWITSVCIFYAIVAGAAILGLRLNNMPLLVSVFVYNISSLVVRILTIILFEAHNIHIEWTSWVIGASEVIFSLGTFSIITVIIETGGISPAHRSGSRSGASTKRSATVAATNASAGAAAAKSNGPDVEASSPPGKSSNPFETPTESTGILRY